MGINFATCDKCEAEIQPQKTYAITKKGEILCQVCAEKVPDQILRWRTATPKRKREEKQ